MSDLNTREPAPADPLDPLAPLTPGAEAPKLMPPVSPKNDRRRLRAVLRWTVAVLVLGSLGAATAFAVAAQERGDLPGLATRDDGRWAYPEIKRPVLPAGASAFADENNVAEAHHADLRALVLPAPKGARPDKALAGRDGWLSTATYLRAYPKADRRELGEQLVEDGLRHIAARGWTTPDGTHTRIYLLQFNTGTLARSFYDEALGGALTPRTPVSGAPDSELIDKWFPSGEGVEGTQLTAYDETEPRGAAHVRQGYINAGDTLAVIVQSRKGTAPAVPFRQTVVLQAQLLG
ncbi:hypothetical protein [Streptomyces sp. NPDC002994]|uniref:hypothetical protein n=1 Tax=Streptomyces sp. NPDC002994 TaxID=3154441 RepID=UPI00339E6281